MSITVLATGFPTDFFYKEGDFKEGVPSIAKQPKPSTRLPAASVTRRTAAASDNIFESDEENAVSSVSSNSVSNKEVEEEEEEIEEQEEMDDASKDKKNRGIRGFFKRLLS
jgi:hypothetical protein